MDLDNMGCNMDLDDMDLGNMDLDMGSSQQSYIDDLGSTLGSR